MAGQANTPKINVLIVDDVAETRENIRKLLQFEPDIEVVGMARTGREGIQLAKEAKPHVVLMDINMPDMDGIQATEVIVREVPSAQIVIVSVQSDTDYLRRAMLAGARDFLAKPPSADELINTIRRLGEMSRQREQLMATSQAPAAANVSGGREAKKSVNGKIVVVYSPKGGSGCTTLATNLAVALQTEETKVVVVDASFQFGDVGVFFNLKNKYNLVSATSRADELDDDFVQSVLTAHPSGVKVLLGPATPEDAEVVMGNPGGLRKVLERLQGDFAYVLVDTASVLRDIELSLFDAAERIVLLATPDIPALKNVKLFFDLADKLSYPPQKMLLVMNKMDRRSGITAANVEESIKHTVKGQIALDDKVVLSSINSGVPFMTGARSLPVAQGVVELAQKLREEFAPKEVPVEDDKKKTIRSGGLFQRR
jgi:pilus assembly protein CpaE